MCSITAIFLLSNRIFQDHFLRQRPVSGSTGRLFVVNCDRFSVTRRFGEPDIPRDHGLIDMLFHMLPDIFNDLGREIRPCIEHCKDESAAVIAFTVSTFREGGQSMII